MQMIPVSSSNLRAVGYDPINQTLRVQFHSGCYDYHNVPSSVHASLMNAASKGSYLAAHIKNRYHFTKIS